MSLFGLGTDAPGANSATTSSFRDARRAHCGRMFSPVQNGRGASTMRRMTGVSALRRLRRRVRALLRRWRRDAVQRLREVTGRDDPT